MTLFFREAVIRCSCPARTEESPRLTGQDSLRAGDLHLNKSTASATENKPP